MKESGYEKVAFASLLTLLYLLTLGGTMVYKILTPIEEPLVLNLVYVAYCHFKELYFYKPIQNNYSREFYIIGKGFKGVAPHVLKPYFDILERYDIGGKSHDVLRDKYPQAFVSQFLQVSNELADKFVYTIERNIYYLDNFDKLTPEFMKLMKTYYDEKNHDWIQKYKPRAIPAHASAL